MPLRSAYGGGPFYTYKRPGVLGRIGRYIPQPLKVFAGIAGLAAATVVLAPAILILATPPLICGAWLVHKRRKMFAQLAEQMHHQRWQDLASFHLEPAQSTEHSERMPTYARIAIESAVKSNDQGLRSKIGSGELHFSNLEMLSQDFSAALQGFAEKMSIAQYSLYAGSQRVGLVRVVERQGSANKADQSAKSRIEIQLNDGSLVVLGGSSASDGIIEGHGHRLS